MKARDPHVVVMVAATQGRSALLSAEECRALAGDKTFQNVARSHLNENEAHLPWQLVNIKANRPFMMAEWRAVPNSDGYEVSSLGHVRRGALLLKQIGSGRYGHASVSIYYGGRQRRINVHKLVAEVFHGIPPADKPLACHRNGRAWDNRADNLYWGSMADNVADMKRHTSLRRNSSEKSVRSNANSG